MTWSEPTEELGRRYCVSYGFTQGWWVAYGVVCFVFPATEFWRYLVMMALGGASSLFFRWCWGKYRAAFRAETEQAVAEAKEEIRLLAEQLERRLQ